MRKKDGLIEALSSLRFTVAILLCLAAICVVGTVFPQVSETTWTWFLLGPYDVFHSIWFMIAGLLLCVNLVLCMSRRLKLRRRNVLMLLLHAGILLVVAGYALGALSLDGFVEIPEGGSVSEIGLRRGSPHDLGFSVRCERFVVDYYENGMPREYVSDLSFLKDGRVVDRAQVKVNHPAVFEGLSFYQENFRQAFSAAVTVSDGRKTQTFNVSEGDVIHLSPAGTHARVVKIWHDLMHAGPAVKLMIDGAQGQRPLYVLRDIDDIKERVPDLFEQMPAFDPSGLKPYTFSCGKVKHSFVTGIGIRRDPGVPLVSAGGALFLVSLLLVYLVPRNRSASVPGASCADHGPVPERRGVGDRSRADAQPKGARP